MAVRVHDLYHAKLVTCPFTGLDDGVLGAELVVVYAGEEEVALVELHDEVVRVLAVGPHPHGHEDVVVELAQQGHSVDPAT